METASSLSNRFREVTVEGKWIANTNYKTILEGVTLETANNGVGELNSVAMLTQHVLYYIEGLNQVFEGGELEIKDRFSFDFKIPASEKAWIDIKNKFNVSANRFAEHIENFSDDQLDAGFVREEYGSYRRNIEGMIEHAYYHLGQISLILKLGKKT